MVLHLAPCLARSVPGIGVLSGIIGGSATLAKNLKARKDGEDISTFEIVEDTVNKTAWAGVATMFSAYAVGLVGGGVAISLGTAFAAAVAGMYAVDWGIERLETAYKDGPISSEPPVKSNQSDLDHAANDDTRSIQEQEGERLRRQDQRPRKTGKKAKKYGKIKGRPGEEGGVATEVLGFRPGTKLHRAISMYLRPQGATASEIIEVNGWPYLNHLKQVEKLGHMVEKRKKIDRRGKRVTSYRIILK